VPPSANFVSLGMIGTTSPDPPSLLAMRCVPKGWTVPARSDSKCIWDDNGTGGKRGSFWFLNTLNLMQCTDSHERPESVCFDLASKRFMASEGLVLMIDAPVASASSASSSKDANPDLLSSLGPAPKPRIGARSATLPRPPATSPNQQDFLSVMGMQRSPSAMVPNSSAQKPATTSSPNKVGAQDVMAMFEGAKPVATSPTASSSPTGPDPLDFFSPNYQPPSATAKKKDADKESLEDFFNSPSTVKPAVAKRS